MKQLAKYSTKRGDAWLLQGEKCFAVVCHTSTMPGSWRIREFCGLSHEAALAKFEQVRAELDGRQYVKPRCKYSPSRTRPCNSKNCPNKLGGAAYWQIFGQSCNYKTR